MNIRLAERRDLSNINELFREVVDDLKNIKKIDMLWGDEYPFNQFENDIEQKEMYVLEDDGKIIGSFALSDTNSAEEEISAWRNTNIKVIYINRFAVSPKMQRLGYAKSSMEFIEKYAKENNYDEIRLVVYQDNNHAINLYEKYGFTKIENEYISCDDKKFVAYEKTIR